ncbi:MAG TPA: hydrogenase, partial [Pelotomaculum sp.]|nr:hydrogenase [Pelotomaculum sp.]HBC92918.1 hydrogenase [Pelotomaculum sp.]
MYGRNWSFRITWFRVLMIILVLIAAAAAIYRFIYGLGAVT